MYNVYKCNKKKTENGLLLGEWIMNESPWIYNWFLMGYFKTSLIIVIDSLEEILGV